jgi:Cu2+-exporting ATPase
MFFQICFLAAALHIGRNLLREWEASDPEVPDKPNAQGDQDANSAELAAPEVAMLSAAPLPVQPVLHNTAVAGAPATETEAQRQFSLALLSVGMTSVATLFFPPLRALGAAVLLYGGIPILARATELVFDERRLGAEVLDAVTMLTTLSAGQYLSASFVFLMDAGSLKLELMTERATQQSMIDLFGRRSDCVWLLKDGVEVSVSHDLLRVGDIVVAQAGGQIPVDGRVIKGIGLIDQHILTGKSQPVEKGIGDKVYAATVVLSGRFHIQAETIGKDTAALELPEMLRSTADFTSTLEAQGQRIADELALPRLAISALSLPLLGPGGSIALLNASFLDSARLFIPLCMLQCLRKASDSGILIKDGRSLQLLPKVDTIVFDKTGTLTLGLLQVRAVYPAGDLEELEILRFAAAAEHRQTHPIASAILDEMERRGQTIALPDEVNYEVGYGLTAQTGEGAIRVGSKRFMAAHGIAVPDAITQIETSSALRGCSVVYVARQEVMIGAIELEATLRPEVAEILDVLKQRKLSLLLLSGDHDGPTRMLAESLGFDHYYADMLPQDKARTIEELQAQGRTVCFVGDGINDSIAFKKASVSISVGGASATAMDSAQIAMQDQGLERLPALFQIADSFQSRVDKILLALGVQEALGVGGVFLAGFRLPAITALYGLSLASALAIAMWPQWGPPAVRST